MKTWILTPCVCAAGIVICAGCASNEDRNADDVRQASYSQSAGQPNTQQRMTASDSIGRQMTNGQGETYVTPPAPDAVPGYSNDVTDPRTGQTRGSSVGLEPASRQGK